MIVEPFTLAMFALASLVLNLTPGPDMLYALGRSVTQGPRAGLAAACGNLVGTLVHTAALLLGLSTILAASADAMTAVRIVGAGVLVVIGLRMVLQPAAPSPAATGEAIRAPVSMTRVGCESFVIHALNPKTAVFFLAFVPQFIETAPGTAPVAAQTAVLGVWFAVQAALVLALISLTAGWAGSRLRHGPSLTGLKRGVGTLLVLLGARLAFR